VRDHLKLETGARVDFVIEDDGTEWRPTSSRSRGWNRANRHDRIIGALELCCRRGEMLLIQNRRINWDTCQIGIPGATAKDKENRRIPFNPNGRLAAILERRAALGPNAYVFGSMLSQLVTSGPCSLGPEQLRAHLLEYSPVSRN
jgi:hypothetical protein